MDVPAGSVRVTILGDEYSIKGDVDPGMTRRVAEYVDQKFKELRGKSTSSDKYKIAILTSMNIAGELFERMSCIEEQKATLTELEQKFESLSEKIEQNL
jgi:cell division protein ZapA